MSDKKVGIHEAVSQLLGEKLKKYIKPEGSEEGLNPYVCTQIYGDIFDALVEVFTAAQVEITNESMNYVAQQYYDSILINNRYELDPNIFSQRARLENIETKELALLRMMLHGTDFSLPIIQEIKRRS
jgi:hypothetical protein